MRKALPPVQTVRQPRASGFDSRSPNQRRKEHLAVQTVRSHVAVGFDLASFSLTCFYLEVSGPRALADDCDQRFFQQKTQVVELRARGWRALPAAAAESMRRQRGAVHFVPEKPLMLALRIQFRGRALCAGNAVDSAGAECAVQSVPGSRMVQHNVRDRHRGMHGTVAATGAESMA
eukprot:3940655-Rhodomonas_salina.2